MYIDNQSYYFLDNKWIYKRIYIVISGFKNLKMFANCIINKLTLIHTYSNINNMGTFDGKRFDEVGKKLQKIIT